jgi:uncharacterized protein YjbJ (UPF0337 family)
LTSNRDTNNVENPIIKVMNENILKGRWKQLQGEVQKNWGKFSQNDLDQIDGELKRLEGKIQEKYGHTSEDVKKQIEAFVKKLER